MAVTPPRPATELQDSQRRCPCVYLRARAAGLLSPLVGRPGQTHRRRIRYPDAQPRRATGRSPAGWMIVFGGFRPLTGCEGMNMHDMLV